MTLDDFDTLVLDPGLSLLPQTMDTYHGRVMLRAIALQESRMKYRRQIRGPARGWFQFESGGGVRGVLNHGSSKKHAQFVCERLEYPATQPAVYNALADCDALACAFARLLLWTLPHRLPTNAEDGWRQYLAAWRPGRPHESTWQKFWEQAAGVK